MYNAEALIMESRQYAPTAQVKIKTGGVIVDCLGLGHEVVNGKMCIILEAGDVEEEVT